MTATFNELSSGSSCCDDTSCCYRFNLEGCAAGVPYAQISLISPSATKVQFINLNTGVIQDAAPAGFVTGSCSDVPANDKVCYEFGADSYQRYSVNSVVTIFKNGTLLTAEADITAANAVIAGATYTNIVSCEPAKVEPDTSVCYQKTVAVPGSDTFAIQSGFTAKRILDGSGTLQERVYNMTYVTGAEADAQYSLRDGSNNRTGSPGSWAIAMNPPLSATPGVPYIVYSQKLLGTPGTTYSAGYWARERSANPAANFRVDVKNGATVIATGTSGSMSTSYTNYRSGTFVMPASGEVTFELYQTVQGNAAGNDPLLDDIGLWTTVAASTSTTTYRKSTLNGVDTYYDENGNVVTGAALTTLLADIAAGVYDVVSCATCGCDPADFISTDPDQALVIGTDGKIYYKEKAAADNATCYSKTVTSPPTQGTAQSPANNTILVPSNTQVTSVWNCTADQMGTAGGTGGFNAPYAAYNGTTPVVVNDDNGMTCSTNARLDQGDILAATFQGYNGVVYGVAGGMRKLSADGLGTASIRIDIRKPDGTIVTGVASGSSTRQGGGAGWDNFGYYSSGGTFTADQTGTYTMLITGTSAAPARLNFPEAKVVSASGEVLTSTPGTTTTTTYRKVTLNGVDTYYDAAGAVVTGAALTALLAAIAAGEYSVVACSAGCECDPADFLSTDAGQSLIIGTDGKIYNASTVLWDDDQVLTGDNTGNTTVTLTPTVITDPDNPGVSQTNYTVKVDVKVDGSTLVTNPTTGVISAVKPTAFIEQNRRYADPNGSDTTGTGANENPYATAQAAVNALGQADTAVLNEGTYGAVTMATPNTTISGASNGYSALVQIASLTATATGTSVRAEGLTVVGNVSHTGTAPLYLNNVTVNGNYQSSSTAYTEIKDSRIQDGTISKTAAGTLFIRDSQIGNATFSTAGSVIAMRNVTIDAGDCVNIGAGVVFSLQDVVGCVNIDPAAVNAEQAAIAGGLTATQAEAAVTSNFHHIRMHNADLEANPTQVVTRDPVTGELEVSNISDIIPDACCVPTGGTDGQVLTVQPDGSTAWETPEACRPKVKVVTADYTLTAADEGYMIYANSATPITITAPAGLPAGFISEIYQEGAGQVTVVGGAGNTLRSANGFKTRVQHSAIGISYQTTALSNVIGDSTV